MNLFQDSGSGSSPTPGQVTKVTATAKFKVEVHAPVSAPASCHRPRRSRRASPEVHSSLSDSMGSTSSSNSGDTAEVTNA